MIASAPHGQDPVPTADVTDRAVCALARFWQDATRTLPRGSYDEQRGVGAVRTGLQVPPFNGVWGYGRGVDPVDVLAAVDTFVGAELPFNVQLRPDYPHELDAAFAERGLVPLDTIPLMVLIEPASELTTEVAATVRPVVTYNDVDTALGLIEQGFELPTEFVRDAYPAALFFLPGATTWIVNVDGTDVSTALAAVRDGVCGIFNVATPTEHRGHGYGSVATAAAVAASVDAGADLAYLQSSAIGYGVYERLGFVTAERWSQWVPQEFADNPGH